MPPDIETFASADELFHAAAQHFAELANFAVRAKGSFTVALSGGSTPKGLYSVLASDFANEIPWDKIFFFWGDERHVPPDHPDSNYRLAYQALLSKVSVEPSKVFRVHSEKPDANAAAIEYEQTLSTAFALQDRELPRFDLILLGLGPDGHTASLFPRTAALQAQSRLVVANHVQKLNTDRITFTLPVLNNAANVTFLVSGKDKEQAVRAVFDPKSDGSLYPAKLISPRNGRLVWMLTDDAAAAIAPQPLAETVKSNPRSPAF
jgi:6-phosphogluconolactonase